MIVDEPNLFRTLSIEKISLPFAKFCLQKGANVPDLYMVRLDRVGPYASGNKFYKLYGILEYAKKEGIREIVSFGGAWSNHIHALALTAEKYDMKSIGIIRGESIYAVNPMLTDARNAGMRLEFVSRETYRRRHDADFLADLKARYPNALIVSEGGADQLALKGCAMLPELINRQLGFKPGVIACASGTGTTAAGMQRGVSPNQTVFAYPVLNDPGIESRIRLFGKDAAPGIQPVKIVPATITGYAKLNSALLTFIVSWFEATGVLLDPVYTCKLCYQLLAQIYDGEFSVDCPVAIIHSGGLQGWRGMKNQVIKLGGQSTWDIITEALRKEIDPHIPL